MKSARSFALQLLDLLRCNLRQAQFSDLAYGTELTNTQARLLDEWYRSPASTYADLGLRVGLDRSTVSRGLARLTKLGYLHSNPSTVDRRRKELTVTERGREFIAMQRRFNAEQVGLQSSRLSGSDVLTLAKYLRRFADASGAPDIVALPDEDEITIQFRRLTYVHGVISGDYLGSGHSAAVWMILSEIAYNQTDAGDLQRILAIPQSSLSVRLKRLISSGLVSSKADLTDRRHRILKLKTDGKKVLKRIERCAEREFESALEGLSIGERKEFHRILGRYVGPPLGARDYQLGAYYQLSPVTAEEELAELRWFTVELLGSSRGSYPLSACLFSNHNDNFRITRGEELVGAIELQRISGGEVKVINLVLSAYDRAEIKADEMQAVIRELFPRHAVTLQGFL